MGLSNEQLPDNDSLPVYLAGSSSGSHMLEYGCVEINGNLLFHPYSTPVISEAGGFGQNTPCFGANFS